MSYINNKLITPFTVEISEDSYYSRKIISSKEEIEESIKVLSDHIFQEYNAVTLRLFHFQKGTPQDSDLFLEQLKTRFSVETLKKNTYRLSAFCASLSRLSLQEHEAPLLSYSSKKKKISLHISEGKLVVRNSQGASLDEKPKKVLFKAINNAKCVVTRSILDKIVPHHIKIKDVTNYFLKQAHLFSTPLHNRKPLVELLYSSQEHGYFEKLCFQGDRGAVLTFVTGLETVGLPMHSKDRVLRKVVEGAKIVPEELSPKETLEKVVSLAHLYYHVELVEAFPSQSPSASVPFFQQTRDTFIAGLSSDHSENQYFVKAPCEVVAHRLGHLHFLDQTGSLWRDDLLRWQDGELAPKERKLVLDALAVLSDFQIKLQEAMRYQNSQKGDHIIFHVNRNNKQVEAMGFYSRLSDEVIVLDTLLTAPKNLGLPWNLERVKGAGAKLLRTLQEGAKTIHVTALRGAQPVYQQLGFTLQSLSGSMVWHKPVINI